MNNPTEIPFRALSSLNTNIDDIEDIKGILKDEREVWLSTYTHKTTRQRERELGFLEFCIETLETMGKVNYMQFLLKGLENGALIPGVTRQTFALFRRIMEINFKLERF